LSTMPIKVLSPEVAARIAAGEVVERPSAVIKELVENSLDAGATEVSVETRGGGVAFMQVVDNGCGIPSDQLEVAFERHATSKLSSAADLESISTLGFRGEALPSIAAVADVEITTWAGGEHSGSHLGLTDGRVVARAARARTQGTTVTARNLFRSVPARLKFLRSTATENSHIANIVTQYALAYPEVRFTLTSDGKKVLSTSGSGRLLDAVLAIYGLETARTMLDIKHDARWAEVKGQANITVTGLVGTPHLSRASRDYISFFVNRRWISGRLLFKAVEDAYHGMLTVGRHPVAIVNIEMPAGDVDVNIHPAKSEVKFRDERQVFGSVQRAVRGTLVDLAPVPMIEQPAAPYAPARHSPPIFPAAALPRDWTSAATSSARENEAPAQPVQTLLQSLPALRLVGQVAASYIVAEGPDGLYLIDQHAAHERILFEKARMRDSTHQPDVQGLLEPITFDATPRQDALLKMHRQELAESGFSLDPFGGTNYLVRAVPAALDAKGCVAALRELLDTPSEGADWKERIAQSVACHGAVRAGQVLSDDEMRQLIRQLEQTANPHTCPHGRPTIIHLGLAQLEREFRRT
jgi:DNA mismatch repair protein MutL